MTKILIIDTQGPDIAPAYRALLPGIAMRGIEPADLAGTPCHEHGAFCGWLAALPCFGAGLDVELVFVRVFDGTIDVRWVADYTWLLGVIRAEAQAMKPGDRMYLSRSWGAWDGDTARGEAAAEDPFKPFATGLQDLQREFGLIDFGAAGNEDTNDPDNDVAFPQRLMTETTEIIGARDRAGIPCKWSGDGQGVACVMWADRIYSPDMTGAWRLWSGTSAATPKACGAAAALGYTHAQFRAHLKNLPPDRRPVGDFKLPHPKWGWGDFEDAWQNQARRVPQGLMPPHRPLLKVKDDQPIEQPIEFFNYRKVDDETTRGSAPADQPAGESAVAVPAAGSRRRGKKS